MEIIEIEKNTEALPSLSEINRKVAVMILPITIEGILETVSGIISMGMIGRIDVFAISALGISMQITQIIWALLKGISIGATIYVARYYGAGEHKRMLSVMQQTLLSMIMFALILQVIVFFGARQLLSIFDPSTRLMEQAVIYMRTVSFGFPFLAVMLAVAGAFQGMGNAHTPMLVAFAMNIVNITVGYAMIFGRLGMEPMGIKGAAVAAVLAQLTAAALGLLIVFRRKGLLHGYLNKSIFTIDLRQMISIYRVGLQSAMETVFWLLAGILVARAIMTFGETAFAAHQLGVQAESISYMPAAGFGIAATAFVGQALGAGSSSLARLYMKQIMKGAIIITGASVALLLLFPRDIMLLLTNDLNVVALGSIYLILAGLVQIPQNAAGVLGGAMKGAGHTKAPMLVAGFGLWGIRVPLTLIFTYAIRFPVIAIWAAMSIDLLFRFILCRILYKRYGICSGRPV